ncbi:MAG TPA: Asp-tRNA(Asn)/Glu-tRNA(Gln) amidotransferase subunit GatA [Candidatus Dojkabacteria bacterium]|nr:Asp-tRNA(Asn)/Glu-tRNA(Gln) amidotransferase subunit GatA [Candidatus Dojkabacteria bacterium]
MENFTITQLRDKLLSKEISATEVVEYYLQRIDRFDTELNSFITVCGEDSVKKAKEFDNNFEKLKDRKLSGIPIVVKDVFSTKDILTTCASKILEGYIPVYNATVVERILDENAIILGKTNLDEFCHGSGTATSCFGASRNPWDVSKLPGGSSGGSSASLAADLCTTSLGTETAGSIRLPASWCGVVGLKPTYGRVSRYGVLAMGSSLDSPGPITKDVKDAAYLLEIIAGHDKNDFTSSNEKVPNYLSNLEKINLKEIKIALPKEYLELQLEEGVRKNFLKSVDVLRKLGIDIDEVSLLDPKFGIAVYTLTCRSEVSSNLARYDGTRYGRNGGNDSTVVGNYNTTRGEGFGQEAKRRIMTGTFSLSAGYADEYFKKSEQVRQLIKEDLDNVLSKYDAIIGPSTPSTALSDKDAENPLFGELADVLAEGSSLAGLPGISIPNGLSNNMPTGIQFIGRHFEEQTILSLSYYLEKEIGRQILNLE